MSLKKKRAKPFAANNASIKKLEAEGWTCAVVEHRIPHCFITKDLFGFADILAMSPSRGMLAVQATGGGNGPARVAKIKAEPRAAIWLACGGRIQVHDWRKRAGVKDRECCVFEPSIEPPHDHGLPALKCCSAPIIVAGSKEGTQWHECTACGKACDANDPSSGAA